MIKQSLIIKDKKLHHIYKAYDFMRWDKIAFFISIIISIASISTIAIRGFNLGLDFTGGTLVELNSDKAIDVDKMREALKQTGFKCSIKQNFTNSHDILMRIPSIYDSQRQDFLDKILSIINQVTSQNIAIKRSEFIGPSVSNSLFNSGSMALIIALVFILIYIGIRFEWRLATGAVIALVHDIIITLGIISLFSIEIDLTIITSLMSVIGYSLNDSIVVFDRIRENFNKICCISAYNICNISLTQTLSRTITTSAATMIVVLMLLIFGGDMLFGFSITLLIGIFIGTISSIYIAAALALRLGIKRQDIIQQQITKEGADDKFIIPQRDRDKY